MPEFCECGGGRAGGAQSCFRHGLARGARRHGYPTLTNPRSTRWPCPRNDLDEVHNLQAGHLARHLRPPTPPARALDDGGAGHADVMHAMLSGRARQGGHRARKTCGTLPTLPLAASAKLGMTCELPRTGGYLSRDRRGEVHLTSARRQTAGRVAVVLASETRWKVPQLLRECNGSTTARQHLLEAEVSAAPDHTSTTPAYKPPSGPPVRSTVPQVDVERALPEPHHRADGRAGRRALPWGSFVDGRAARGRQGS